MNPNPAIGVLYHWLGGLASGSFYVPYRGVKRWAWETFWLTGGFFSWIIAPWFFGLLMTKDLLAVLHETPGTVLFWTFFFGLLWGVGGLTFGLTMRYLGLVAGNGRGAWPLRRFRNPDSANLSRRIHDPGGRNDFRAESFFSGSSFACSASRRQEWPAFTKSATCRPNSRK